MASTYDLLKHYARANERFLSVSDDGLVRSAEAAKARRALATVKEALVAKGFEFTPSFEPAWPFPDDGAGDLLDPPKA